MSKHFSTFAGGNFMLQVREQLYAVQKLLYTHREYLFQVREHKIYGMEK